MCRSLLASTPQTEFSVSYTTRPQRPNETNGKDYHFVDDARFDELVEQDAFLEWAPVHGRRYGTARAPVEDRLSKGIDVVFDVDVQGGEQIKKQMPESVLVFITAPNMEVLAERLRGRASDSADQVERRLQVARKEVERAKKTYEHWIVNDDLETAVGALRGILTAERQKRG